MKSFAAIEEINNKFVVCELELLAIEESKASDFSSKETCMAHIPIIMMAKIISQLLEGDIIVVEHENGEVSAVYYKDDLEKQRRIAIIKQILNKN